MEANFFFFFFFFFFGFLAGWLLSRVGHDAQLARWLLGTGQGTTCTVPTRPDLTRRWTDQAARPGERTTGSPAKGRAAWHDPAPAPIPVPIPVPVLSLILVPPGSCGISFLASGSTLWYLTFALFDLILINPHLPGTSSQLAVKYDLWTCDNGTERASERAS
ncbi:hypothetical protein IWX50DRAFT_620574 [Phyllosticta citricarpa]